MWTWYKSRSERWRLFVAATAVALLARAFLFEIYRVKSESMSPTLHQGALVFASKASFGLRLPFTNYHLVEFSSPDRASMVVFALPDHPDETYIKRVVAIGGDRLEMRHGKLLVNGVSASYEPVADTTFQWESIVPAQRYLIESPTWEDYGPIDVPEDHVFVLGDNRAKSIDSRQWGPIPTKYLRGRAATIWQG